MPELPHLPLPRLAYEMPRRRHGGGRLPERNNRSHGRVLGTELTAVLRQHQSQSLPPGINPALVLRIDVDTLMKDEVWENCGLTVLGIDDKKRLVLFSSDEEMADFKARLNQYRSGSQREEQRNAPYSSIFAHIERIGIVEASDRIGPLLRKEGIRTVSEIAQSQEYVLDVLLWDFGTRSSNISRVEEVKNLVQTHDGRTTDEYVGGDLIILRVICNGALLSTLLNLEVVRVIDLPPQPSLVRQQMSTSLEDYPPVDPPSESSPAIAVIDTGITTAHPLLASAVGEATSVPRSLGSANDQNDHGTFVAGLALYGDISSCIDNRSFSPALWLYSARVLNRDGRFDDRRIITTQMREAIAYFRETYGCKVFNISLGDDRQIYSTTVGYWADSLDSLAREFNVVIVVSAGNIAQIPNDCIASYPHYLFNDQNRIIEPATGAICLTVGALSHAFSLPDATVQRFPFVRPIASEMQPSPFTRTGLGHNKAIKPDLCDIGGNVAFDARDHRVIEENPYPELSVVSLNRRYLDNLFANKIGTSMAAPLVAHAAASLYSMFPNASANLIRALLASSARVPQEARELLEPLGNRAIDKACGYGQVDLIEARSSDENRVVLFAESELDLDHFHVYQVPIPSEFQDVRGRKTIDVVLAYDPPVNSGRIDYLGGKMSFRLLRGRTEAQVVEACRQQVRGEETVGSLSGTRFDCQMSPTPRIREPGTLQKATFQMTQANRYGETFYLVVRCEKQKWVRPEYLRQRYAVVVTLKHQEPVNIYNRISQRTRAMIRGRV